MVGGTAMILVMCYCARGSLLVCVLRARMCSGVHIIPRSLPPGSFDTKQWDADGNNGPKHTTADHGHMVLEDLASSPFRFFLQIIMCNT